MKNYLINLDRDKERLLMQERQFSRFDMAYERVAAIENAARNRFRWWCAVLRPVVKGELGCAASHCECYRRLVESGEPCAAVFEDDVALGDDVKATLGMAEKFCEEKMEAVVLLGDHRKRMSGEKPQVACNGERRIVKAEWDNGSEGYVIGRVAAATLLSRQSPVRVPADWWRYFAKKGWIELYRSSRPVCWQPEGVFESNIGVRYVVAEDPSVARRMVWRIKRMLGVVIDTLIDGKSGW